MIFSKNYLTIKIPSLHKIYMRLALPPYRRYLRYKMCSFWTVTLLIFIMFLPSTFPMLLLSYTVIPKLPESIFIRLQCAKYEYNMGWIELLRTSRVPSFHSLLLFAKWRSAGIKTINNQHIFVSVGRLIIESIIEGKRYKYCVAQSDSIIKGKGIKSCITWLESIIEGKG